MIKTPFVVVVCDYCEDEKEYELIQTGSGDYSLDHIQPEMIKDGWVLAEGLEPIIFCRWQCKIAYPIKVAQAKHEAKEPGATP